MGKNRFLTAWNFTLFQLLRRLANASENGLRECGLGYRAKYVQATAKKIQEEKIKLEDFKRMPYLDARKKLLEFPGVGLKVADCVLLVFTGENGGFPS